MHNRPDILWRLGSSRPRTSTRMEGRLVLLALVLVGLIMIVARRVTWLQTSAIDRYSSVWDQLTTRTEPIPAREGRILTADGQVLAYDETRYDIAVHYRWLESPPDDRWLNRQALDRLSPADRKSDRQVAAARAAVLAQRDQMHRDLAAILHQTPEQLQQTFASIQQRVERIVAAVEARRPDSPETTAEATERRSLHSWQDWWTLVVEELTTPPRRLARDPIIVAEELDYHVIAQAADKRSIALLRSYPTRFPGVDVRQSTIRLYPQRDLAAHLVGVRTAPKEGEDPGLLSGSRIGRSGIELAYDRQLRGRPGVREITTNRQGEIVRERVISEPVDGRDVTLTIDSRLQKTAEHLLDTVLSGGRIPGGGSALNEGPSLTSLPTGGCLLAVDVRTGELLAAAAAPRFDSRLLVEATQEEWDRVASDPRRPFFPRVTQATLPPGSVFKLVTAVALLESGTMDPDRPIECRGYFSTPDRERCAIFANFGVGHGPITLERALYESCNYYFFHAASELGPHPLAGWARRFGFGGLAGIDLPGEKPGFVPTPARPGTSDERWYPGTTRQLSIGQGALTATPLQVLRMIAAIANDGWLLAPRLARPETEQSSSEIPGPIQLASFTSDSPAHAASRVPGLSPGTLERVRRSMRLTVEHPRGTGRSAALERISIAGKTGTAEVGGDREDHAWFAGFAPAEAPRIAFVVVIEHGGSGGRTAAPLAREFVRRLLDLGLLSPRPSDTSSSSG